MRKKSISYFTGLLFIMSLLSMGIIQVKAQDEEKNCPPIKVEVKNIGAQKALVLKAKVPTMEIGKKMGEMYERIFGYMGINGIEPVGPPFTVYYEFDPEGNTLFEAGVPVGVAVDSTAEVEYKEYPAMKVASTLYTGPYEEMGPVYTDLEQFITDNGLKKKDIVWEIYLTDPTQEEDPANYQTVVYYTLE